MKFAPWVAAILLAGLLYWQNCVQSDLVEEGTKLDSVYVADTLQLTKQKARYTPLRDSVLKNVAKNLNDSALVKKTLHAADSTINACERVKLTCEQRVANLKQQLKPGWLKVWGEGNYQLPPLSEPLLKGSASLKVGVSLRLNRTTFAQAYLDQPLTGDTALKRTLNVGIRKEWRLF